uniref:Uncharacterized protein n=1 Tax=Oryza rufipogon TaxID=4529 RepID=A0A0E0MRG3_ORYRU
MANYTSNHGTLNWTWSQVKPRVIMAKSASFPMLSGITPDKEVDPRSSVSKPIKLPMSVGMLPETLLPRAQIIRERTGKRIASKVEDP